MDDLLDIIGLYKEHYPLWSTESVKDIYYHIYPSLSMSQYSIHRDESGIYGFTNWAFLDDETEQKYLEQRSLDFNDWRTGSKTWVIESFF